MNKCCLTSNSLSDYLPSTTIRRTYVISVKKRKCKLLLQRQNYAIHDFLFTKYTYETLGVKMNARGGGVIKKMGIIRRRRGSQRSDTFLKIHNNCQNGKYLDLCRLTLTRYIYY